MNLPTLVRRSLTHYWRTNAAVVLGVAAATAVLSGALLVGDSVRGSLRDLVLQRLGQTDRVIVSSGFFREALAEALRNDPEIASTIRAAAPLLLTRGFVAVQGGGGSAGNVAVYGVDERFWKFHDVAVDPLTGRQALISPALAIELGGELGDELGGELGDEANGKTLLIRVQRPSDVPLESLHGRKEDAGRTIRGVVRDVLQRELLGEFSLQAQQGDVRAVFLPLQLLQNELQVDSRVNTILISGDATVPALEQGLRRQFRLEDVGVRLRTLNPKTIVMEADSGVLDNHIADAAKNAAAESGIQTRPLLTYLANSLNIGGREVPYSLVTSVDFDPIQGCPSLPSFDASKDRCTAIGGISDASTSIVLNDWAAKDLGAKIGDSLVMEFLAWEEPGQLATRTAEFHVVGVVPVDRGDAALAPTYPGITDASSLVDWDPPFPLDLRRIRSVDEDYWKKYSTTPKAFIPLEAGQQLWRSRYGALTSVRFAITDGNASEQISKIEQSVRSGIDPLATGLSILDVRVESLDAARGATNFGEYFVYFSFFLVVSALLLSALFFKLSVEQRVREIGLLRAVGFQPASLRRLFIAEGAVLSLLGVLIGVAGAIKYAALIVYALGTWWIGAVGTESITLHVTPTSLIAGCLGGLLAAVACIALTLRGLSRSSERSLLAGTLPGGHNRSGAMNPAKANTPPRSLPAGNTSKLSGSARNRPLTSSTFLLVSILLMMGGGFGMLNPAAAFFGGGASLLTAALTYYRFRLAASVVAPESAIAGTGWQSVSRLGLRSVSYRPARSVTAMATIAAAAFIIVSVDSFRKGSSTEGTGGYSLVIETLIPVVHDPNSREGQESLNLVGLQGDSPQNIRFEPFRLRPGDDTSCLNLYEPKNPRILGTRNPFIEDQGEKARESAARFAFQSSLAETDAERENPWLLLQKPLTETAAGDNVPAVGLAADPVVVPVIADANSLAYVLHRKLGDVFVISHGGRDIHLKFVAALSDSIFQGALLMSEENFLKFFPEREGYSVLLAETATKDIESIGTAIEDALIDYGADAVSTAARLDEFHRVENTYLTTFQMLGGLGLLLGTVGLAAVLLRSVFERRREIALLQALGYRRTHLFLMTLAENAALLAGGLLTGILCAAIAIAPALVERGGRLPALSLLLLLAVVPLIGIALSIMATAVALRTPLLEAIRSE